MWSVLASPGEANNSVNEDSNLWAVSRHGHLAIMQQS
jgi:hypothetical protein